MHNGYSKIAIIEQEDIYNFPEDKKVSVYEAYKDMTPEGFEAEILRELEEEANGSYVLDDSDIMIGVHSDSPSDINDN